MMKYIYVLAWLPDSYQGNAQSLLEVSDKICQPFFLNKLYEINFV